MKSKEVILLLAFVLSFMLINNVSAITTLSEGKQESCIVLPQSYANSTYQNITFIQFPDKTTIEINSYMTKVGSYFNYTFCNTSQLGTYIVNGIGDYDGVDETWAYDFSITPTGKSFSTVDISVYIFFLLVCLAISFFSVRLYREYSVEKDELTGQQKYELKKRKEFIFYFTLLKKKLWILGVFGLYLSILTFVALLNQLVYSIGLHELNSILINLVQIMAWGLIPFCIFWIAYVIIFFYRSTVETMRYQFGGFGRSS